MSTNLTVIIPTFNRPGYLKRILSYYNSYKVDFNFIVADSSFPENKVKNREIISSFSSLSISYLGDYSIEIDLYSKISNSTNYVATEYCVFCADDDFITPRGIEEAITFLQKHPDYVTAQGKGIGFIVERDKRNRPQFRWRYAYPPVSIENAVPAARMEYHVATYQITTIYGVYRSETLKKIYNQVSRCEADLLLFGELLATALTALYGKIKCLDVLHSIRNAEPAPIDHGPGIATAIKEGTFEKEYLKFKECLTAHVIENSGLNLEDAETLIDRALSAYLHKHGLKPVTPIPKTQKRALLDSLHLPIGLYHGIVSAYAVLIQITTVKTKLWYEYLIGKRWFVFKNRVDFNQARQLVLSATEGNRER